MGCCCCGCCFGIKIKMIESIIKRTSLKDMVFVLIGSIAIVAFWRGTWNLLDYFLLPANFIQSQVLSIILGIMILIALAQYK